MNKKLTPQLLAMYLGCRVECKYYDQTTVIRTLVGVDIERAQVKPDKFQLTNWDRNAEMFGVHEVKPILRPLSDMTEEERREWEVIYLQMPMNTREDSFRIDAAKVCYLLSKSFDLFGLIESGEAIETTDKVKEVKP